MKSKTWLRIAAGLLGFFAFLHTWGTLTNNQTPGSGPVLAAMRNFHFNAMGSDRTPWDFFHGLGLLFSANLAVLTVLAWQAGSLSETDPPGARPIVTTLIAATVLIAVLSWVYFFLAPIVISVLTVLCVAAAALTLPRRSAAS